MKSSLFSMIVKNVLALLFAATAVTNACASAPRRKAVTHRIVQEGGFALFQGHAPQVIIASDPEAYAQAWNAFVGGQPPAVDFSRESALFLFAGTRHSGGYSIALAKVAVSGSAVTVSAVVKGPARGSAVTQSFTSPYLVVAVPQRKLASANWIDDGGRTLASAGHPNPQ